MKRRLLKLLVAWPWTAACKNNADAANDPQRRFKGIPVILVVDAVAGAEMEGVVIYDDQGIDFFASALVARNVRKIASFGGMRIPLTVRAVWRESPKPVWGKSGGIDYEGKITGDYTIAVAERIPEEVLADIRAKGGGLRLKFRLKPDGVLFGWDIERDGAGTGHPLRYDMPGGDFLETRY